jgi:hypothetical protein
MEKASDGSFARTTEKRPRTKDDDEYENEKDWEEGLQQLRRLPSRQYENGLFARRL